MIINTRSLIKVTTYRINNIRNAQTSLRNTKELLLKSPEFDKTPDENLVHSELHNSEIPSNQCRQTIAERQLAVKKITGMFAVPKQKCKYGYSQAFVQYPVGGGISSGMIRLSCPHLVKAVDEYESNGGIDYFNQMLREDSEQGAKLRSNFQDINDSWSRIRSRAITDQEKKLLEDQLGSAKTENLINSGIIGISISRVDDVKCLHAQIADTLIRGEASNNIGSLALKKLEENGCDIRGCDSCHQQCDINHVRTDDSYFYLPAKNKQKLRRSRLNRIVHKQKVAASIKRRAEEVVTSDTNSIATSDTKDTNT